MFITEMMSEPKIVGKVTITIGMLIGFLFGGWSELLTALLVLQGLDVLLGVMTASKRREVSSRIFINGIQRKFAVWLLMILAHTVDSVIFGNQAIVVTGLVFSYIAYEGLSIIENVALLGAPVPSWLKKILLQVQRSNDKRMEDTIEGIKTTPIKRVIIQTEDGKKEVLHNDEKVSEYYEKVLCDDCDNEK